MAQTKQVVLVTTITATGAIVKNRFVNFKGAQLKLVILLQSMWSVSLLSNQVAQWLSVPK